MAGKRTPSARRLFLYRVLQTAGVLSIGRPVRAALRRRGNESRETAVGSVDAFRAALHEEIGDARIDETDRITLNVPAVAEDGAVVPVTLESHIPLTDRLVLFVEKNPFPLVAAFQLGPRTVPCVSLRIKMNASCDVFAVARAENRYSMTKKPVRVVVGGCG